VLPSYPDALTVKFWNKAKGVLARIKQIETGITKELEAARSDFDKAPWADLSVEAFLTKHAKQGSKTRKDYEQFLRLYLETLQPPFKKLEGRFDDLASFLKKKAQEFEEDPQTKGFAKAVQVMADAAHKFTFAVAWGTVSSPQQAAFAQFMKEADEVEKQWKTARNDLTGMIDRAEKAVTKAKSKVPTASAYAAIWKQELRGIGAQIAMAARGEPQLLTTFKDPMKIASIQWAEKSLPKDDKSVEEQIKKDIVLVGKFKQAAATL
jgi:hypothetical protein